MSADVGFSVGMSVDGRSVGSKVGTYEGEPVGGLFEGETDGLDVGSRVGKSVDSFVSVNTWTGTPTLLTAPLCIGLDFLPLERVTAIAMRQVATSATEPLTTSLNLNVGFVRISCSNLLVHAPL